MSARKELSPGCEVRITSGRHKGRSAKFRGLTQFVTCDTKEPFALVHFFDSSGELLPERGAGGRDLVPVCYLRVA